MVQFVWPLTILGREWQSLTCPANTTQKSNGMEENNTPDQPSEIETLRSGPKRYQWMRWLGTLASIALLVYLLEKHGWNELLESLQRISWPYFLLAFVMVFLSRMAVIGRWYILLHSARVEISFWDAVRLVFSGLFASNFLPTTIGGDLVRFLGAVRLNLDAATCAASLVVDRLIGMAGMASVLPLGLVTFFGQPAPASQTLWPSGMVAAALPGWDKIRQKALKALASLWQAVRLWIGRPGSLLLALVCTWGHMLSTFLAVWILLVGMGESISFWMVAGLWSMTYFITLLPVSVNGMGVQEISIAFLFTNYGKVSMPSVLAMAILIRALYALMSLPGALFLPTLIQPARRNSSH